MLAYFYTLCKAYGNLFYPFAKPKTILLLTCPFLTIAIPASTIISSIIIDSPSPFALGPLSFVSFIYPHPLPPEAEASPLPLLLPPPLPSLSEMVKVVVLCEPSCAPPVGFDKVRFIVSSDSTVVSLAIDTVKVWDAASPSAQLRVPLLIAV